MAIRNSARIPENKKNHRKINEQIDREVCRFQQTEFAEHKAECLARNGIQIEPPSPSASSLWHRGLRKWGSKWLERDSKLRHSPYGT